MNHNYSLVFVFLLMFTLGFSIAIPTIEITSPGSFYDYLYDNQTVNLDYNIADANLDSCWYTYIYHDICYQESANVTNQSGVDDSCNLDYSGAYNIANNVNDGSFSTYEYGSSSSFEVNYTKPLYATTNSRWVTKRQYVGSNDSYSIPVGCFDYSDKLIFKHAYFETGPFNKGSILSCYNGTEWENITIDGGGEVGVAFYEEAMNWSFNNDLNCSDNTTFQYSANNNNLTVYANDTFGNINSSFISWTPLFSSYSIDYGTPVYEGTYQTYTADVTLSGSNTIDSAFFSFNNTNYTASIYSSGGSYILSSSITLPSVSADENVSIDFFITVDGTEYTPLTYNQSILDVAFSNCTAGDALATFLLVDEELQTALFGDIEISAYITNPTTSAVVSSINLTYTNVSNASICLTPNSSFNDYKLFYEVRYTADDYVSEFYNVKNANMSAYPKYIALYDLASNDSTEFIVEYRNDNYVTIEDAVVLLLRQYLAEDSYKVVEAPTTSSTGTSILHVDLNTNKYRVIVLKDGVILNTFTNIVFHCENELSGQCTQELYGGVDPQNTVTLESLDDFSYSVTKVNETLTLTYSVPSGSASVNLYLYQIDLFGNTYLCNETVYSSGGSIDCSYNNTIGDSMVYLEVRKDGELMASKSYFVEENTDLGFLGNNFFIVFIFIVTITGMALSSPEWMVIMSVITLLLTGSLWLLNGLTFAIGFGSLMWLIVAAGIIIFKLSRQEDR